MNAYKKRLSEAYGYADEERSFEEVYGNEADSLFEGYEVPDRFKKLFEAEKAKNIRLKRRLHEATVGNIQKYRKRGEESMLKSIPREEYDKLFESKKLAEKRANYDETEDDTFDEFEEFDNFLTAENAKDDFGEDAMGLAEPYEDEDESDWDDGPMLSDDFDYADCDDFGSDSEDDDFGSDSEDDDFDYDSEDDDFDYDSEDEDDDIYGDHDW